MTRAIAEFHRKTGNKIGFKPAGGIKTANDALQWLRMIEVQLGSEWLNPEMFRFGASSLLNEVEREIFLLINERSPMPYEVSL